MSDKGCEILPLRGSDFELISYLEDSDGSDRDTRKRKRGLDPGYPDSRNSTQVSDPGEGDHAPDDRDDQREGDRGRRRRRCQSDFVRVRQRDDSLFGFLTDDDDGNDTAGARSASLHTSTHRRDVKDTSILNSQQVERRHRSTSSSASYVSPRSGRGAESSEERVPPTFD